MTLRGRTGELLAREWLPLLAVALLLLATAWSRRIPAWSRDELEVLALLGALLVAVRGLTLSGLVRRLARRIEAGRWVPLRLVLATWLLSMVVTNDVALLAVVPLTLALRRDDRGTLVILEALAANAGSALTPVGNPQNLFLYWHYHLRPGEFVTAIAPFSLAFLVVIAALAFFASRGDGPTPAGPRRPVDRRTALGWTAVLLAVVLVVVHVLPFPWLLVAPGVALLLDRRALSIDWGLLVAFACFFGIADDLRAILAASLTGTTHVFLLSALASQVLSNVPAALLFSEFTADWRALLWGVSVGGFGTLVASLANLIAWRLYVADPGTRDAGRFTLRLHLAGGAMLVTGIVLWSLSRP